MFQTCSPAGEGVVNFSSDDLSESTGASRAHNLGPCKMFSSFKLVSTLIGTNSTINNPVSGGASAPPNRPPNAIIALAVPRPENGIHLLTILALVG